MSREEEIRKTYFKISLKKVLEKKNYKILNLKESYFQRERELVK